MTENALERTLVGLRGGLAQASMDRFVRTERQTSELRLVAALGAAAILYLNQTSLPVVWALVSALWYLIYVLTSLLFKYVLLPRVHSIYLAYLMIVVDVLSLTTILFVTKSIDTSLTFLFPVFILYYSIHLGYVGSFFTATTAMGGLMLYARRWQEGPEVWLPTAIMFYLVAFISGFLGHRILLHEAEASALQTQLIDEQELKSGQLLATVLFTDIVDSTVQLAAHGDRRWREIQDAHHTIIRNALARYGGPEVKTLGDGFLAIFDKPQQAVACAKAIAAEVQSLGIQVRVGLHTGVCEVEEGDVGGIAVHIAARVMSMADGNEVLVSSTLKDLLAGSDITFVDKGNQTLKGLGDWRLFSVERVEVAPIV